MSVTNLSFLYYKAQYNTETDSDNQSIKSPKYNNRVGGKH